MPPTENFGRKFSRKFSPGFSGIFRGWNTCYSPKFVFLKNKNRGNFEKFREEISGKFREIFPEKRREIFPEFFCVFWMKTYVTALNLFFKNMKIHEISGNFGRKFRENSGKFLLRKISGGNFPGNSGKFGSILVDFRKNRPTFWKRFSDDAILQSGFQKKNFRFFRPRQVRGFPEMHKFVTEKNRVFSSFSTKSRIFDFSRVLTQGITSTPPLVSYSI